MRLSKKIIDNNNLETIYNYDVNNNVIDIVNSDGTSYNYEYNGHNKITSIKSALNDDDSVVTYDYTNEILTLMSINNKETYQYLYNDYLLFAGYNYCTSNREVPMKMIEYVTTPDKQVSKIINNETPNTFVVDDTDNYNETIIKFKYVEDEEEEKTWLVTDVLLYTDRNDNIGNIASKIVGHPHSLELDPKTVDYEFIKEGGKTKIRFKKGKVFGLSVLGTNEKPAFTGSQFFFSQFGDLAEPELREKFELFFNYLEEEGRGEQMNITKEQFDSLLNAAKLSYTEQEELVHKKFNLEIGDSAYAYITRMYSD